MEYRSCDSVFLTPLSSWIIDRNSLVTFVAISQWTPLWLQSSHHKSRFQIATSGPCACMLYCCLLRSYLVSFIHFVCIVGSHFRSCLSLELHPWKRVGGWLIRADSHQSSDSSIEMSDELASTLASIQEFMARVSRRLDQIESSR